MLFSQSVENILQTENSKNIKGTTDHPQRYENSFRNFSLSALSSGGGMTDASE